MNENSDRLRAIRKFVAYLVRSHVCIEPRGHLLQRLLPYQGLPSLLRLRLIHTINVGEGTNSRIRFQPP